MLAGIGIVLVVGIVMVVSRGGEVQSAQQSGPTLQSVPLDPLGIGGLVLNRKSRTPEAGVWVIAETDSLPAPYRRMVVTDDQGRFLVPDLPEGAYDVWVRGYGLRDSSPVKASRGGRLTLEVASARTPQEAAQIYPATYWLSLFKPASMQELPKGFSSQAQWIAAMKTGCSGGCHQLGGDQIGRAHV